MRITSQDEHDDPATAKPLDKIYDEPLAIASAEPRDLAELFSHLGEFPSKTVPENSSGEQKKRKKRKTNLFSGTVLWNAFGRKSSEELPVERDLVSVDSRPEPDVLWFGVVPGSDIM